MRGFVLAVDKLAPSVIRVSLRGELDLSRALLLDNELHAIEKLRPRALVIDLRELEFLDSTGISRLLAARRRADRGGWQLSIVRGRGAVRRIMQLSAMDRALPFVDDPAEALAAVTA